jgi:hypothetical protein
MSDAIEQKARLASLDEIIENVLPVFLAPAPTKQTLRHWFDSARIPRFKANATAVRGGGPCYYSLAHVERFLRSRTLVKI